MDVLTCLTREGDSFEGCVVCVEHLLCVLGDPLFLESALITEKILKYSQNCSLLNVVLSHLCIFFFRITLSTLKKKKNVAYVGELVAFKVVSRFDRGYLIADESTFSKIIVTDEKAHLLRLGQFYLLTNYKWNNNIIHFTENTPTPFR